MADELILLCAHNDSKEKIKRCFKKKYRNIKMVDFAPNCGCDESFGGNDNKKKNDFDIENIACIFCENDFPNINYVRDMLEEKYEIILRCPILDLFSRKMLKNRLFWIYINPFNWAWQYWGIKWEKCVTNKLPGIRLFLQVKFHVSYKDDLRTYNYKDLWVLKKFMKKEAYIEFVKELWESARKQVEEKKKIKVSFVVFLDTIWSGDYLYEQLDKNERFDVQIALLPLYDYEICRRTEEYYLNKGYKVQRYDGKRIESDILFFSSLYDQKLMFRNAKDQKLSVLNIWIPYTFWFDRVTDGSFETENATFCWKCFLPSELHKEIGIDKCYTGNLNMFFSGYPKMDKFYTYGETKIDSKWCEAHRGVKKIIYAPGYFSSEERSNYATFDMNSRKILGLARKYNFDTSWIIRPHPLLGETLVNAHILQDISEYESYLQQWRELPNADVNIGGDYYDLFRSSDAMILDSISFVSGYQYVKKPILYLARKEDLGCNMYGEKLMEIVYRVKGDDFAGIEDFIENVVIDGKDEMKEKREAFFERYLDYKTINNMLASDFIYENICESLKI